MKYNNFVFEMFVNILKNNKKKKYKKSFKTSNNSSRAINFKAEKIQESFY